MRKAELESALHVLGETLEARGITETAVLIGGGSLLLIDAIERPTKDLDVVAFVRDGHYVLAEPMPPDLAAAVADVGESLGLAADWLNPGPTELLRLGLPNGFAERVERRRYATLDVHIASRYDQVHFKLYAASDDWPLQTRHFADLLKLRPTRDELSAAATWAATQDPSSAFDDLMQATLRAVHASRVDAFN